MITLDFEQMQAVVESCGMVWVPASFSKGKKYRYMLAAINLLAAGDEDAVPSAIVTEAFFANPKQMMGSAVVPTINSFANMAADALKLEFHEMGPTTWRGILGIKAIKTEDGKRDYKTPTADYVRKFITLPEEIPSNINRKLRKMPNDITDVLALALALVKHHGIEKVSQSNTTFHPFSWLEKLEKLSKEI
jgi:hypothetical protein